MNAKDVVVYQCEGCGKYFNDKNVAESCCESPPLCACGKPLDRPYWRKCSDCIMREQEEKHAVKEKARFDKAAKIPFSQFSDDEMTLNGDTFEALEYVLDCLAEEIPELPEYVWACRKEMVQVKRSDIENMLENIIETVYSGCDEPLAPGDIWDVDEIEEFFNQINKKTDEFVYEPDYSRAIVIDKVALMKERSAEDVIQ